MALPSPAQLRGAWAAFVPDTTGESPASAPQCPAGRGACPGGARCGRSCTAWLPLARGPSPGQAQCPFLDTQRSSAVAVPAPQPGGLAPCQEGQAQVPGPTDGSATRVWSGREKLAVVLTACSRALAQEMPTGRHGPYKRDHWFHPRGTGSMAADLEEVRPRGTLKADDRGESHRQSGDPASSSSEVGPGLFRQDWE